MMGIKTKYWTRAGKINTKQTLKLALKAARLEKINYIIIASTTGATTKEMLNLKPAGIKLISIAHHTGFTKPGISELRQTTETYLAKKGVVVYRGTHFFGGMGRAVRMKFGGLYPDEIAANVLRIFGEGVKVGVEIATMALDAGLIPYGKRVIAIGGTNSGADAALIVVPAHGKNFFATKVQKIICMPSSF